MGQPYNGVGKNNSVRRFHERAFPGVASYSDFVPSFTAPLFDAEESAPEVYEELSWLEEPTPAVGAGLWLLPAAPPLLQTSRSEEEGCSPPASP